MRKIRNSNNHWFDGDKLYYLKASGEYKLVKGTPSGRGSNLVYNLGGAGITKTKLISEYNNPSSNFWGVATKE